VGQGTKAGPVTWAAVSSILFEAQDLLGTGLIFQNPERTLTHQRHSDGFVDDTTGYHSIQPQWINNTPSITTIFNGLRKDAQIWERLLWTSGGKLALDKCRFYMIYWKFDADGAGTLMSKDELNAPILLLTKETQKRYRESNNSISTTHSNTWDPQNYLRKSSRPNQYHGKEKRRIRPRDIVSKRYPLRSLDGAVRHMAGTDELSAGSYIVGPQRM
jgi:hypothetical protein